MQFNIKKTLCILIWFLVCFNVHATTRLIIKYKPNFLQQKLLYLNKLSTLDVNKQLALPLSKENIQQLSKLIGYKVQEITPIKTGAHAIIIQKTLNDDEINQIFNNLKNTLDLEYVVKDIVLHATDTQIVIPTANSNQWDLLMTAATIPTPLTYNNGDNFSSMFTQWQSNPLVTNILPGANVIVGVIDSGYTPHPNYGTNGTYFLQKSLIPSSSFPGGCSNGSTGISSGCFGELYISDCGVAGYCRPNGEDVANYPPSNYSDALDIGTYYIPSFKDTINTCINNDNYGDMSIDSSWHGSHVTGTIIGQGNNSPANGVLGGAFGASVYPIRVIGTCGGWLSDIENGMARIAEINTQHNPSIPILNASIGGDSPCDLSMQDTVNILLLSNVIPVVAAGNSTIPITQATPAGCNGVISVSAKSADNNAAYYSNGNFGDVITTSITASGGGNNNYNGAICGSNFGLSDINTGICSTIWNSSQQYAYNAGAGYMQYIGTSMAAPHISAILADLISYLNVIQAPYSQDFLLNLLQQSSVSLYSKRAYNPILRRLVLINSQSLNAGNAFNKIVSLYANYIPSLASSSSLKMSATNSSVVATFQNQTQNDTPILTAAIYSLSNHINIVSDTCTNNFLAKNGGACSITLTGNGSSDANGLLALTAKNGANINIISSVVLNEEFASNNEASSNSGGGGCSMIRDGNDMSMLFILIIAILILYFRKLVINFKD